MKFLLRHVILALAVAAAGAASPAGAQGRLRVTQNETFLVIFSGAAPVLQYRLDGSPYKPYIKELFTPGGVQVLRDAPADHLHHHGIMFAVAADGVTFWTETPEGGRQVPRDLAVSEITTSPGLASVSFTQRLDWMAPNVKTPALEELRTIEVLRADELPATMVTWRTRLSPAEGRSSVELTGEHYYGLGCRLLQSLDRTGRFLYAVGEPGPIVRGQERVTPSAWCAYAAPAEQARVTVAVFDHPGNPRHPAAMFTMPVNFAYLAATLNLWKEPMTLKAGQTLSLVYGVALWDGQASAEEIDKAYQKWTFCTQAVESRPRPE